MSKAGTTSPPGPGVITASMLYDLVQCPHRLYRDLHAPAAERDPPNPFVQLLWEKGSDFERDVMASLATPWRDLSHYPDDERERRTAEAVANGEDLIYGGRLRAGRLLGDPDLLRREDGGYVAGDIKSGAGKEGSGEDARPKPHYAVQLGLYTDILQRLGRSAGRRAFVWDVHKKEVPYDFDLPRGVRNPTTLWAYYLDALALAEAIADNRRRTLPAYGAVCKLCHWYSACVREIEALDDLTMIPELGRSRRDRLAGRIPSVRALAETKPADLASGRGTGFPGIGSETLLKYRDRARLLSGHEKGAWLREPLSFPTFERELYFDVEVDPMRELCYLHGFIERLAGNNDTERFVPCFAEEPTADAEEAAFAEAIRFLRRRIPCGLYFYSGYERTWYRKLQERYPSVCTRDDIEEIFAPTHAVDLYNDVVRKLTEWPTWDYSIKTLASYLGFAWRDTHPSGAASIEWFHRWVLTRDPALKHRIFAYNEDDCRATRVLRDGIASLPLRQVGAGAVTA